jgi:membrane protease YdiL (CAAX protease family)
VTVVPLEPPRSATTAALLLSALGAAVVVRVAVAGPDGAGSLRAGLAFAGCLAVLGLGSRAGAVVSSRALVLGAAGAVLLGLPAVATRGIADVHPAGQFLTWAAATTLVAVTEEAVLRGALFDALDRWRGPDVAVVGAAIAFALLHVPLYGWYVVPLDLAVGLLLGALRLLTGTWTAPAVAHTGADLIGWWTV